MYLLNSLLLLAEGSDKNFLEKLVTSTPASPIEWLLVGLAILLYGQIAFLITVWAIFSFDLFVNIVGLVLLAMIAAFVIPRRPRPIALVVLAAINFVLGTGITIASVAEGAVPAITLISLLPLAALLVWAIRSAISELKKGQLQKQF